MESESDLSPYAGQVNQERLMPSKGSARWLSQIAARGDTLGSLLAPSGERRGSVIRVTAEGTSPLT